MVEVRIGDRAISVERARLRKWFELEAIRENLRLAAERGDILSVSDLVCAYLSAASGIEAKTFESADWVETMNALIAIENLNMPRRSFPIFDDTVSKKKEEDKAPWDYDGRVWYSWVNMIAAAYGWTMEEIGNLEIEDGIAVVQEITMDRQMKKEWEWSLSELAYPYDPSSKKSVFKALPRPPWMVAKSIIKPTKMLKSMLPVGNIENLSGMALHGEIVH